MVKAQRRLHFCGLDSNSDASFPAYYREKYGVDESDCHPFSHVIRADPEDGGMFTADTTSIAWHVPLSDSFSESFIETAREQSPQDFDLFRDARGQAWVRTEQFNATYSPEKMNSWFNGRFHDDDFGFLDPLWRVSTERYGIINPDDAYAPLEDALRELNLDDGFYGHFRLYKGGGLWFLDGMFNTDSASVSPPGASDPLMIGFNSGSDFFGNTAFYAEGFAQDTRCTNSIRSLTDQMKRKHTSRESARHLDYEELTDWWERLLRQIFDIKDQLVEAIADAIDVTLPLNELPFDIEEFYELVGFPNGSQTPFASMAKVYCNSYAESRFAPTMWDVHSGATAVLEHEWNHSEGDTFRDYVRIANDLLFNPHISVERARDEFKRRIEQEGAGASDTQTLDGTQGLAQIQSFEESIEDKAEEWETRQNTLQTIMEASAEIED